MAMSAGLWKKSSWGPDCGPKVATETSTAALRLARLGGERRVEVERGAGLAGRPIRHGHRLRAAPVVGQLEAVHLIDVNTPLGLHLRAVGQEDLVALREPALLGFEPEGRVLVV